MWHARGDDASRVSPRRASRPRSRRRRTPPPPPEHATLFLFVHDPPDRPSRSSPRRAVRESHPTDPLPSHAPPLRPVLKTRVRSWTAGRGHDFAVPATRDPISGKFFAALDAPSIRSALVAWGDGDPVASLDALIGGSTARLVGGVAALVPAGNVQGGGVLAVDAAGAVRWFGPDARKLAASAGDARDSAVEAAAREAGGGGVLVVTRAAPKPSRAKKNGAGENASRETRVATLYRAAGSDDAGRRVERAWRVEARPPAFASDGDADGNAVSASANRVIAAAAEGDELTLVVKRRLGVVRPARGGPGRARARAAPRRRRRRGTDYKKPAASEARRCAAGRRNRGRSRTPRRRRSAAGTSLWPARARAARASPCWTRDTEACTRTGTSTRRAERGRLGRRPRRRRRRIVPRRAVSRRRGRARGAPRPPPCRSRPRSAR